MEKKIILTKRFRKNSLHIYEYLLENFSAKTAYLFLERLEERIDFIVKHPESGKRSLKKNNVRSILLTPHNHIFYRCNIDSIEILCLFDMRKNPKKNKY
jgi:plasmid stabilization system protein ParE